MPLLLDELGAVTILFGLLLKGVGSLVVLGLLLVFGFRHFARPASTGDARFDRTILLLLGVLVVGIFLLFAIIGSL